MKASADCNSLSTGSVHARVYDSQLGEALIDLTPGRAKRAVCGTFDELDGLRIRQSDGKLFYLLRGNIYQYVPDAPKAANPLDNDIKVNVSNSCGPNPKDSTAGPFMEFYIKPSGGFMFACVSDLYKASPEYRMYDEAGASIWINPGTPPVYAVDDRGNMLMMGSGRGAVRGIWDHGTPRTSTPSGPDADCYPESLVMAVRALPSGFWLVLQNYCGVQLWLAEGNTLTVVDHYLYLPNNQYQADDQRTGEVAADRTFYFTELCNTNISCFHCDGMICAVKSNNRSAVIRPFTVYPPDNPPDNVLSSPSLLSSW